MYGSVATTAATSWPWKRTLSVASTACVSPDSVGIHARLYCASSSPVTTATTPSSAVAADVSIDLMQRVRHRRAQDRHVQHAGQHVVVEEVALAGDEPVVLVAAYRVADAADLDAACWASE